MLDINNNIRHKNTMTFDPQQVKKKINKLFNRFGIQSVCVRLNVCLENDLNKSRIFIRSSICINVHYVAFECADFVYFGDQANEFIMNVVSVAGF